MMYRALVGIQGSDECGKRKAEREAYHECIMKTMLKRWSYETKVLPYFDPSYNTDKIYSDFISKLPPKSDEALDPLATMTKIGKTDGHVFYASIPDFDKKNREHKKHLYEKALEQSKKNGKPSLESIEERYGNELIEPVKSKRTGLYAYSTINPYGMFKTYNYPIQHSYIPDISDVSASKLLNRNYGTMHDMILLGDLDFDGTYLPHVVFRNDGEMFESYQRYDKNTTIDPGGNPDDIMNFLTETLTRKDYVAIIECEA